MARVHEVLRWANRRDVAREVTRRGYRLSGETLNRWVREESEFPAVVERIVFELFGLEAKEAAPPEWAKRLQESVDSIQARQNTIMERQSVVADAATQKVIETLADPERLAWAERIAEAIRAVSPTPDDEASDGPPASEDRDGGGPGGPGLGSSRGQSAPK